MVYSDGRIAQCRIRNHPNGEVDLNADHPRGKDKAHVFATVLGLTRNDAKRLATLVQQAARQGEVTKEERSPFGYYQKSG